MRAQRVLSALRPDLRVVAVAIALQHGEQLSLPGTHVAYRCRGAAVDTRGDTVHAGGRSPPWCNPTHNLATQTRRTQFPWLGSLRCRRALRHRRTAVPRRRGAHCHARDGHVLTDTVALPPITTTCADIRRLCVAMRTYKLDLSIGEPACCGCASLATNNDLAPEAAITCQWRTARAGDSVSFVCKC